MPGLGILQRQLPELLVHAPVEVFAQEKRPEPVESVHLRCAESTVLAFWNRL